MEINTSAAPTSGYIIQFDHTSDTVLMQQDKKKKVYYYFTRIVSRQVQKHTQLKWKPSM
jgi:hypothetical protein